jgi:signal transduction histidine kinase
MPIRDLNRWRTPSVLVVIFALLIAGITAVADPAFPQTTPQTLTSAAQLGRLSEGNRYAGCSFRLEGVVCAVNPAVNSVIVRDGSGDLEVQLNLREHPLQPGQEVLLEGSGDMVGRRLNLITGAPLVDNDGVHGMVEVAGTVYLKAGRHPIRLVWFNATGEFGLEVYYQGPELPRQKIPGSVLFHKQTDSVTGTTNLVNGLDYRCYEGTNWEWLPDISRLKPVKTGTTTNFDVSVISQTNSVCLEFTGYVEVARDGLYTFSTSSDDGSRLFVGEPPPFRLKVAGSSQTPAPRARIVGQPLSQEEENQWSEMQGTVTFIEEQPDGCELELTSETARMRVTVADNSGGVPPFLLNSQVRVRGICEGTYTGGGRKAAGAMMVTGWDQIKLTHMAAERWTTSPLATVSSLLTNSFLRTNAALVRLRGKLREATPDQPLLLEDETGSLQVEGIEASSEAVGSSVEMLGKLNQRGTNMVFLAGFCQEMAKGGDTNAQMLPLLTTAKQIQYLSAAEAKRKYPVRLRGVVTSSMSWHNSFTVQDATRGIWVDGLAGNRQLRLGEFVEVEGVTDPSQFAPIVISSRVVPLGLGQMPEPIRPNRDQMINGSLDAQYVEIQGVVTAVETNGVALLTLAGKYRVLLFEMPFTDFRPYENALVRIKGCLYASWDEQTYQIKIGELRLFNASINVDEPAPADLFAAPVKSVKDLLLFDAKASALKRVKVTGQIVHERAGEYFMMNGTNGLRFFLKTPAPLQTGDFVEVVGFPMLGNASPVLNDAVVRQTGKASLPEARRLTADTLFNSDFDATVVQVESKLVGVRSVPSGQELELQTGMRTFVARLDTTTSLVQPIPAGSRLQLTGVYAGRGGDRSVGRDIDSFELLLNSPADVRVLEHPSWWTVGHALAVVGVLVGVLLLAFAWISGLRRQVEQQTRKLKNEIEEHKRTEIQLIKEIEERKRTQAELEEKKVSLENEIEARKRMEKEIEHVHRQLLDTSRRAGMAEIATNVLHNVGNVLNSVNVTTNLLVESVRKSRVSSFSRVVALLQEHAHDLGVFITSDSKGKLVPTYLAKLSENLLAEQEATVGELNSLRRNIEHINEIVAMQQNYAKVGGVKEIINVVNLVDDSLCMNESALSRHHVEIVREFENVPPINVDKHKLLQILVNLVRNAKQACQETERADKRLTVRVANGDGRIKISVIDNGVGILPENLTRIFNHGFTTRKDGHGFGLHSGALAAKEMGGSLNVHSDGPGQGAAFTLELPCPTPGGPT